MRKGRTPLLVTVLAALSAVLALPVEGARDELFPRPVALQPAIKFWTRVYSQEESQAGFVHDSRHLNIVYQTLRFKSYSSPSDQDQTIAQVIERYQTALLELASGKREGLDKDQQKILSLWGEDVGSETLKAAAENVRFQRGQADRVRDGIIRAGAWEPHIRKTLRDLGLPAELAALPHVESSYNPVVRSSASAAGIWQFTRFTGKHYLRVDHVVDERFDPFKSTEAAARLLKKNYSRLNSWPLAITAYNHGLSGVRRAVRETGSEDIGVIVHDYAGPRFGFASRNYYAAFLAVLDVVSNAEHYFGVLERDDPDNYWTVRLPVYLPVSALTEQLDLDAESLETLNPALQPFVWSGNKYLPRGYHLRLPPDTGSDAVTALFTRLAIAKGRAKQLPDIVYQVQRGDTLSQIAERHGASVRDLMALNNLQSENRIRAGQSLRLLSDSAPELVEFASLQEVTEDDRSGPFESSDASARGGEKAPVEAMLDSRAVGAGSDCMVNC